MTAPERRHFNRVNFKADAKLSYGDSNLSCQVVDLSLHGALIKLSDETPLNSSDEYILYLPLSAADNEVISMSLKLTHQEGLNLGMECTHIDLDSITHLRRIVELNLGDSELLDRDFQSLCADGA